MEKNAHRLQFRFWLDVFQPEEERLAEYIDHLKEKRLFAQTLRHALRLVQDLRRGQVTVLLELFPWIEEYFRSKFTADPLQQKLEQLTHLLLEQGAKPLAEGERVALDTPRQVSEENFQDKLEIKQSQATDRWGDAKGRHNLLLGLNATDPRQWGNLPTDSIEYGLEMGKFPQELIKLAKQTLQERQQKLSLPPPRVPGNAQKLAGAEVELPPPEEFDLLL